MVSRSGFSHPHARIHVELLGPCFKTGRLTPCLTGILYVLTLGWWTWAQNLTKKGQPALIQAFTPEQPRVSLLFRQTLFPYLPPFLLSLSRKRVGKMTHRITSVKGTSLPTPIISSPSYSTPFGGASVATNNQGVSNPNFN